MADKKQLERRNGHVYKMELALLENGSVIIHTDLSSNVTQNNQNLHAHAIKQFISNHTSMLCYPPEKTLGYIRARNHMQINISRPCLL